MIHTEEQINVIIDKLYNDLDPINPKWTIGKIWFQEKYKPIRGESKGEERPVWKVAIEDEIFNTTDFLTISDETGDPLYFQTKHGVYEIFKHEDGTYYMED